MIIAGIDPGLSGAVAFLDAPSGWMRAEDLPVHQLARGGKAKREVDAVGLADLLRSAKIGHAFLEQVGPMPKQGVSSVFSFGKTYGVIIGALAALGIPVTRVPPALWKRTLLVPAAKDGARARASELMPQSAFLWPLVKHDGRAEAALIALYGCRSLDRVARAA